MSTASIHSLIRRYFPPSTHPYRHLEHEIASLIRPEHTVLEIGCGRTAPTLTTLKGQARALIGIDLVDFAINDPELRLFNNDVCAMADIAANSVDLAFSRSVMEHVEDAPRAYAELNRVLRPGGSYIFLTPNFWDYGSLIAWLTPNRLHARIVRYVEGRSEADTFPTHYRTNTRRSINQLAHAHGFTVETFIYLGQYPNYLSFNYTLFKLGCWYASFLRDHRTLHGLQGWIFCRLCKLDPAAPTARP